ncbi:MAG: PHP domain-containing protein [Thermovirgaceae bacterium]
MKRYYADLHVHTVLSPCAELDMGAPEIVDKCRREGIDIIAVTDHNASGNTKAVSDAACGTGLTVICGVEVQSSEDIHILCLFPDFEAVSSFEKWIRNRLPPVENRPESFGYQLVIDKNNKILEQAPYLLLQGIEATAEEVILKTREHGGASILAHIDRPVYSYVAVLGLIPDDLQVDAVELSGKLSKEEALAWKEKAGGRTIIRSSDAHRLSDLKGDLTTDFLLERPCFEEIVMALGGSFGRKVFWPWE